MGFAEGTGVADVAVAGVVVAVLELLQLPARSKARLASSKIERNMVERLRG